MLNLSVMMMIYWSKLKASHPQSPHYSTQILHLIHLTYHHNCKLKQAKIRLIYVVVCRCRTLVLAQPTTARFRWIKIQCLPFLRKCTVACMFGTLSLVWSSSVASFLANSFNIEHHCTPTAWSAKMDSINLLLRTAHVHCHCIAGTKLLAAMRWLSSKHRL